MKKTLTTLAALAALSFSAVAPDQAATLFADSGYRGQSYSGSYATSLGSMDNKTSSIRTYGQYKSFYDGLSFTGGGFSTSNDMDNLQWKYMGFYGFINDTISSFR